MPAPEPVPELDAALARCCRELDRRELTAAQVRTRLDGAGTPPKTVEAALEWLIDHRLLDDAGYAVRFAEDRRRLDGWGVERIARRLEALGVARDLIDAALAGREAGEEFEAACAVLTGRCRATGDAVRDRRRALGLLLRRGYEAELAQSAVELLFKGR